MHPNSRQRDHDWRRLRALYREACALPPHLKKLYVTCVAADRPALAARLDALLAVTEAQVSSLAVAIAQSALDLLADGGPLDPDERQFMRIVTVLRARRLVRLRAHLATSSEPNDDLDAPSSSSSLS